MKRWERVVVFALIVSTWAYVAHRQPSHEALVFDTVFGLVRDRYVEPMESEAILRTALQGMLDHLDPYSGYMPPADRTLLQDETRGSFGGIGVVIETALEPLTVRFPLPGGPAEQAGIGVGDRITAVDGTALAILGPGGATGLLRGTIGEAVEVTVAPVDGSAERQVTLTRARVPTPSVRNVAWADRAAGLAYARISSFTRTTAEELRDGLEGLEANSGTALRGLALDLRFARGGLLDGAVDTADLFVMDGLIVTTRGRDSEVPYGAKADATRWSGLKIALLVNGQTASASEVLAAALRDHGLATLVGSHTFGKAQVQTVLQIDPQQGEPFGVRLTTAMYETPSGASVPAGAGLSVDVEVETTAVAESAREHAFAAIEVPDALIGQVRDFRASSGLDELRVPEADPVLEAALADLRRRT